MYMQSILVLQTEMKYFNTSKYLNQILEMVINEKPNVEFR